MVDLGRLMRAVVSFEEAVACVDAASPRLGTERVRLQEAMGRVLAQDIRAATPIPPDHCAALDGFAVRADDSLGAGAYNPLELPLLVATTGAVLPPGADAVIPFDAVEADGLGHIRVVEPVAPGDNVERRGAVAETGAPLAAIGIRLAFRHIGMLAAAERSTRCKWSAARAFRSCSPARWQHRKPPTATARCSAWPSSATAVSSRKSQRCRARDLRSIRR